MPCPPSARCSSPASGDPMSGRIVACRVHRPLRLSSSRRFPVSGALGTDGRVRRHVFVAFCAGRDHLRVWKTARAGIRQGYLTLHAGRRFSPSRWRRGSRPRRARGRSWRRIEHLQSAERFSTTKASRAWVMEATGCEGSRHHTATCPRPVKPALSRESDGARPVDGAQQ